MHAGRVKRGNSADLVTNPATVGAAPRRDVGVHDGAKSAVSSLPDAIAAIIGKLGRAATVILAWVHAEESKEGCGKLRRCVTWLRFKP